MEAILTVLFINVLFFKSFSLDFLGSIHIERVFLWENEKANWVWVRPSFVWREVKWLFETLFTNNFFIFAFFIRYLISFSGIFNSFWLCRINKTLNQKVINKRLACYWFNETKNRWKQLKSGNSAYIWYHFSTKISRRKSRKKCLINLFLFTFKEFILFCSYSLFHLIRFSFLENVLKSKVKAKDSYSNPCIAKRETIVLVNDVGFVHGCIWSLSMLQSSMEFSIFGVKFGTLRRSLLHYAIVISPYKPQAEVDRL